MTKTISILLSMALAGCHVEPPTMPEQDAARRRRAKAEGREALAQQAALAPTLAEAEERRAAAAAKLAAVETNHQSEVARAQASARNVDAYGKMLGEAEAIALNCTRDVDVDRLVQVHKYLAEHEAEPRRDAAIVALEPCRKKAVRDMTQLFREIRTTMRSEYAVGVEDRFDENNPYSRSKLIAVVKGETLQLRMRGNFEGRARHSQEQVDALCEETSLFTQIVLRNSHGTFTCRPSTTPQQSTDELLADAGLLLPWVPPAPGERSTPQRVPPPPPPPLGDTPLQHDVRVATAKAEELAAADAALTADATKARATIRSIDDKQASREQVWRADIQESSKRLRGAGVGFVVAGSVATALGAYSAYLRSSTQESIDAMRLIGEPSQAVTDKHAAQTGGMIAGLAIGLPLAAVGAILIVAGKRRKDAAQAKLAVSPAGVLVRF